jgi:hypothetical protein
MSLGRPGVFVYVFFFFFFSFFVAQLEVEGGGMGCLGGKKGVWCENSKARRTTKR